MNRYLLFCLFFLTHTSGQTFAGMVSLRDSIGVDSSLTDGLGGASTAHDGAIWNTPGMVVDVPNTGVLAEAKIVIFATDGSGFPENSLANILGYTMEFHVWSDGIQGGLDSFNDNAIGSAVSGHTVLQVNSPTESFISVQEFGTTGPINDPTRFTTFLVAIDLSSFNIEFQSGQQYVVGVTEIDGVENFVTGGGSYRHIGSLSTGFEDLFQQFNTPVNQLPGFLNSQLGLGKEQHAGSVRVGNGDYDVDNDVDGFDFLKWQSNFGQSVPDTEDSNGDGIADNADLAIWESMFGDAWPAPLQTSTTVPEPSSLLLIAIGFVTFFPHTLRRAAGIAGGALGKRSR